MSKPKSIIQEAKLKLSLTEEGKSVNRKLVVSRKFLESQMFGLCEADGIILADNVGYLQIWIRGIYFRKQFKKARKRKKGEEGSVCGELVSSRSQKGIRQESYEQSFEDGWFQQEWEGPKPQPWYQHTEKCQEGNWPVHWARSFLPRSRLFLDINKLEIEHLLVCADSRRRQSGREEDVREAWKIQVWQATSRKKGQRTSRSGLL